MKVAYIYGGVHATDGGIGLLGNLCSQLRAMGHTCLAILGGEADTGPLLAGSVDQEIHLVGPWNLEAGWPQRHNRQQANFKRMQPRVQFILE